MYSPTPVVALGRRRSIAAALWQATRWPLSVEVSVARFVADQRTSFRVPHTRTCLLLGVSLSWLRRTHEQPQRVNQTYRRITSCKQDG